MLASYSSIRTRACDKCLKIIDDNLQFAVVRESKTNEDSTDKAETLWLAYHRKCAQCNDLQAIGSLTKVGHT